MSKKTNTVHPSDMVILQPHMVTVPLLQAIVGVLMVTPRTDHRTLADALHYTELSFSRLMRRCWHELDPACVAFLREHLKAPGEKPIRQFEVIKPLPPGLAPPDKETAQARLLAHAVPIKPRPIEDRRSTPQRLRD